VLLPMFLLRETRMAVGGHGKLVYQGMYPHKFSSGLSSRLRSLVLAWSYYALLSSVGREWKRERKC